MDLEKRRRLFHQIMISHSNRHGRNDMMVPPSQSKRVAEDKVMAQFSPEAMRAAEEAKRQ